MKIILLYLLFGVLHIHNSQEKSIDKWIQEIVNEMIEMNDLGKYSYEEIPYDTNVDFIMVESVKDINIDNDIISMLVNHGTSKYCTQLKFKYVEKQGEFYLVFGKTKTSLGIMRKSINPWIEKNKICE